VFLLNYQKTTTIIILQLDNKKHLQVIYINMIIIF